MFDVRGGFQPSSLRSMAGELTAVLDRSNTLGPERGAERMIMYLDKRCWPCAPRCEVEPDLFQQIPFHQMDVLADRKLVSRRDLLSTRTEDSLPTWRVCNEANTRGVPRSGEGFLVTLGQTEQQHGGRSFSSRVLSALAQIQRRCQVKEKQGCNRLHQ